MSDDKVIRHESFGFIRASRVQGHAELFDSAVKHQHYVTITIGEAEQHRRHSETYVHGSLRGLIEISMSEAQFAQFITSMNVGSGAPCTLTWVNGQRRQPPPADINTRETFEAEVQAKADKAAWNLKEGIATVRTLVDRGKANKGELREALEKLETAQRELVSNMPFLMKQFAEGIEKLTERAKMDLNAHAVMLGQRMIANGEEVPQLTDQSEG